MAYGILKCDTVTFTNAGVDKSVSISGLVQNPTFSGNVTVTGTLSGVTVTGTTASFTSGNFTSISGGTHTITSGVFAAGSAASPSIAFTGDLNTGIYSPGADQVAISTGGSGRLFIDSSGRVGIGVTSVSELLHIKGGSSTSLDPTILIANGAPATSETASVDFGFNTQAADPDVLGRISTTITNRTSGAQASTLAFSVASSGSLSPRMTLTGTGLGIGTTSPNGLLDVRSATTWIGDGATDAFLQFNQSATAANRWHIGTGTSNALIFYKGTYGSGSETARIDSSGRLLVGTSTARSIGNVTAGVEIEGTTYNTSSLSLTCNNSGGDTPTINFGRSKGSSVGSNTGGLADGDDLGYITFSAADGTDMNSRSAWILCEVDGVTSGDDVPGRLVFSTTADGASSPTERMRIVNNGVVIINNTTDLGAGLFQVNDTAGRWAMTTQCTNPSGGTYFHWNIKSDATNVGSVTTTTTTTSFNTSSDYRLKENISAVTNGIARLQQLKPSRFNFKIDPTKIVDGFIAHEVQTIVPEAIIGEKDAVDPDGNPIYQGIDQSKLVPLLTAALQEAVAKIESLEARLTAAGI